VYVRLAVEGHELLGELRAVDGNSTGGERRREEERRRGGEEEYTHAECGERYCV
jgi:hypothetical protein